MALLPGVRALLGCLAVLANGCFYNPHGSTSFTSTSTGADSLTATSDAANTSPDPTLRTTGEPTTTTGASTTTGTTTGTTAVDPGTTTTTTTTTGTGLDTASESTNSTSTGPDTSSGPGTTTADSDIGPCSDPGTEPNESEAESVDLGEQYCKAQAKSFEGAVDGNADVDWYRYHGDFSGNACNNLDPDPIAKLFVLSDGPLEVCMYADCDIAGDVNIDCPNGTVTANSPDGRKGCCGTGSMEYVVNCIDGADESAMVYVSFRSDVANSCTSYVVDYSFLSP